MDIVKTPATDIVWDLRFTPWPWKDNEVDEAHAAHFLEHLTGRERITFMNELHRVLKPGAQATIITPYWSSMRSVQDPTHEWPPIAEASYLYFNKKWREDNKLDHYAIYADFDFGYAYNVDTGWAMRNQEARDFALRYYSNVVADLVVTLTKR